MAELSRNELVRARVEHSLTVEQVNLASEQGRERAAAVIEEALSTYQAEALAGDGDVSAVLLEEIIEDDAVAEPLQIGKVNGNLLGTLTTIAPGDFRRNSTAIRHNPVHDRTRRVAADRAEMIG